MDPQKTVLFVDDDPHTRDLMSEALTGAGYRVLTAESKAAGHNLLHGRRLDLVILDLTLPDGSGLDLCREVRTHPSTAAMPVIILSGQGALEEKREAFGAGADQYLVKPVPPAELLMWVEALLRRTRLDAGEGDELLAGDLSVNPKAFVVRYKGEVLPQLTTREFELLCYLVRKRPQVLSRKQILRSLWHTVAVDSLVDAHIFNLRRKLPAALADHIQSVPGKGYRYLG